MVDVVVLDAGIALAWFIDPPGKRLDYAISLLDAYKRGKVRFIVPDIFFVEVPYVLLKAQHQGRISAAHVDQAARFIDLMTTDVVPSTMSIQESIKKATIWELKTYDATYFDLAVTLDVPLAAIDKDLTKKAAKFDVPIWMPDE
ncbi:type II toxin-antitoxin system VapC family toxin [Undibacterium sp. Jales W-56]|uniref:type II toxin-antitoxin system VapC family toxin n=1 Tax=Undibacterium sp. Jales W-56 TaxID=2897325 RepID=UPI0021D200A3|nr:type II toxin-antitoxin system VapC family toxin [Undibacterium sp. Jales W-56]MCU6435174.1 type II toxin-antitoxin system VapC family toxin [Undibacterium sp. Jales W-56]